jgi:hypothetical protein
MIDVTEKWRSEHVTAAIYDAGVSTRVSQGSALMRRPWRQTSSLGAARGLHPFQVGHHDGLSASRSERPGVAEMMHVET